MTGSSLTRLPSPQKASFLINAELRKNAGSLRDLGAGQKGGAWGRQVATIPFITYDWALRNNFDLNSTDKAHAGLEMNRFLSTPEGKACLVQG